MRAVKVNNRRRGEGAPQIITAEESRGIIIHLLLDDGEPHRYDEIVEKTKLSTATVSKHLKELVSSKIVEKKVDLESGKYPYPVTYQIAKDLKAFYDLDREREAKHIPLKSAPVHENESELHAIMLVFLRNYLTDFLSTIEFVYAHPQHVNYIINQDSILHFQRLITLFNELVERKISQDEIVEVCNSLRKELAESAEKD